ncbi:MAG: class I SAM-dependent methyltransferase [Legionellaceae bacterium]|nr:class I SAM-dependent methyltransferase [Legionellaceae bacterium]
MIKSFFKKLLFMRLSKLKIGLLTVHDGDESWSFGDQGSSPGLSAVIRVISPSFYSTIIMGGSLGAADAFVQQGWETDDLTAVLRLFLRNQITRNYEEKGRFNLAKVMRWLVHQLKRNNIKGSRRNIAQHYDLSNDFFNLFLDENMMYSSAMFPTEDADLNTAARYKLDVICKKLDLKPNDTVLEIGAGWGGFALHAAEHYGCKVVTTTISQQQYDLAKQRIADKNLSHQITLLQQDYRHLTGTYDKIVSIEMIEAVGHQYYATFFSTCSRLLKPNGQILIQAITIQDQVFDRAKHEVDFIKRSIFPGSCIPSVTSLLTAMTRASDLRLFHLEDIGLHYAKTLRIWRERFFQAQENVTALGFDNAFIRLWDFYFSYCEAGFAEGYLGDMQLHFVKPLAIRAK